MFLVSPFLYIAFCRSPISQLKIITELIYCQRLSSISFVIVAIIYSSQSFSLSHYFYCVLLPVRHYSCYLSTNITYRLAITYVLDVLAFSLSRIIFVFKAPLIEIHCLCPNLTDTRILHFISVLFHLTLPRIISRNKFFLVLDLLCYYYLGCSLVRLF